MELIIQLNHSDHPDEIYELPCDFEDTHFKNKWLARFYAAKERNDPISEPWAFYNLNDAWTNNHTVEFLNQKIEICNELVPGMFSRYLTDIADQDTLNYLHSVFELHHGKLDEWKTDPLFEAHPTALRESLSHINQTIHRCEESNHNDRKIRVVYFDLPKTEEYAVEDYELFTTAIDFGGVYVHYTDVGKPIEELAVAEDEWHYGIVPYLHYSADFSIRFNNDDGVEQHRLETLYKANNSDLLRQSGFKRLDYRLTPGSIKIAQLKYEIEQETLAKVSKYNNIYDVIVR